MRVYLDGVELGHGHPTLAGALRAAVSAAEASGRMVVEANADGRSLSQQELSDPSTYESAITELRLESIEPRSMFRETLLDAVDALACASESQQHAAELLQTGRTSEASEPLKSALATWQMVREVLDQGAEVLHLDLRKLKFGDPPVHFGDQIVKLASHLVEVKRSLATEDWSALSDVLAYDLHTRAQEWQRMLYFLADQIMTDDQRTDPA